LTREAATRFEDSDHMFSNAGFYKNKTPGGTSDGSIRGKKDQRGCGRPDGIWTVHVFSLGAGRFVVQWPRQRLSFRVAAFNAGQSMLVRADLRRRYDLCLVGKCWRGPRPDARPHAWSATGGWWHRSRPESVLGGRWAGAKGAGRQVQPGLVVSARSRLCC